MDDPIKSYLHDHLAGSKFAVELLTKMEAEFQKTRSGNLASQLLSEVQSDRKILQGLIDKIGEASHDLYDVLGWFGEKLSRFKLHPEHPADLSALEAFETLSLGILGKRSLWEAMKVYQKDDERLVGPDYDALIARAEEQYNLANRHRLSLVTSALSAKSAV